MTTQPQTNPLVVRASAAEKLTADPTGVITLLVDAADSNGAITSNRTEFAAGSTGAPPHFHSAGAEMFFVIDGTFEVLAHDKIHTLHAGDVMVIPPGVHHAFGPAPLSSADVLVVFAPGRERFDYYRLLDRFHVGEATVADITDSQHRFDNHYVTSEVWEART